MRIRTVLALFLLLPSAVSAQEQNLDTALSAIVRISGTRNGTPVRGSGFVVGREGDKATIVTASHVIEGVQRLEVSFAADRTESFPAGVVLGLEAGNPRGLAVFQARGALPVGVISLSFETEAPQLQRGEDVFLLGFPEMATEPVALRMSFAGPEGNFLRLDRPAGEGLSGAPVLRKGKVVGVVTDEDLRLTYAVKAAVVQDAVLGWGVRLSGQSSTPVTNTTTPTIKDPTSPESAAASKPISTADRQKMEQVSQGFREGAKSLTEVRAALQLARELADAHPDWREAQYLAAEAAYRNSRWSDAVAYFRRGGDPKEDQPALLFYMAVALYETGDTTGAASALRRSLPNLQRSPYVDSYAKKVLGLPPELNTCTPGEERIEQGIVFVRICPGTFTMGSAESEALAYDDEKPTHQVTLSEFWIGKTEITNEQYRSVRSDHEGEATLPATSVSWADAQAACEHFGGRLPTEAQWEYAARTGKQTVWSFGDDERMLGEYAWYSTNSSSTPHSVGTKRPNTWRLHDMYGNVWEWVADWYGTYPTAAQHDPPGPTAGAYRVLRGGAFDFSSRTVRSANRNRGLPEELTSIIGFRCARRNPPPPSAP